MQIGVQRSLDSVLNFTTIGYATNPTAQRNAYLDNKPLPGKNYYRLFILFKNNTYLHTKVVLATADTSIQWNTKLGASDIPTMTTTNAEGEKQVIPGNHQTIYTPQQTGT